MSLSRIKRVRDLAGLARVLGYTPSGLAYILYKIPESEKYRSFEVPKKAGGTRQIDAPTLHLSLLQQRLAKLLLQCLLDIEKSEPFARPLSHGFFPGRSILTNANYHRRRRFVLNLDLRNFFPEINFGRVRGFFLKDKNFLLNEKISTIIAQIACKDGKLPQGSPCSPVISNLIGRILDKRMAAFSKKYHCRYSRYADDITISTNQVIFPTEVAVEASRDGGEWSLGKPLVARIESTGFKINEQKTRMQCGLMSAQIVTGLVVNEKVNVSQEYYRKARALCHEYFRSGKYFFLEPATLHGGSPNDPRVRVEHSSPSRIRGIVEHIHNVKMFGDNREDRERREAPLAINELYRNLLFFINFIVRDKPLIVTEGKTDVIYLKLALAALAGAYPELVDVAGKSRKIDFLGHNKKNKSVLKVGGGTGDIANLIRAYPKMVKRYSHAPMDHPVIIIIDNDDGSKPIFTAAREIGAPNISLASEQTYYHLCCNLFLVKTQSNGENLKSCIEDYFDPALRNIQVSGKVFDPLSQKASAGTFGKIVFAKEIVSKQKKSIDFTKFGDLFDAIKSIISAYGNRAASATPSLSPTRALPAASVAKLP